MTAMVEASSNGDCGSNCRVVGRGANFVGREQGLATMRLLHVYDLRIREFSMTDAPPYVIASPTWRAGGSETSHESPNKVEAAKSLAIKK